MWWVCELLIVTHNNLKPGTIKDPGLAHWQTAVEKVHQAVLNLWSL